MHCECTHCTARAATADATHVLVEDSAREGAARILLIGGMIRNTIAMFALAAVGAVFTGCEVQSETITHDEPGVAGPVMKIVTNVDVGDVVVNAGTDTTAHVEAEAQWSAKRPSVKFRLDNRTLYIDAACGDPTKGGLVDPNCRVDITVKAPVGVVIEVNGGDTSITAADQRGAATLLTSKGDIMLEGMSGTLTLGTLEGEIRGNAVHSAIVKADAVDGNVNLVFDGGADDVSVTTAAGDMLLTVPRMTYRVDARTAGKLSVGVTQSNATTVHKRLYLRSDSGDITVKPR